MQVAGARRFLALWKSNRTPTVTVLIVSNARSTSGSARPRRRSPIELALQPGRDGTTILSILTDHEPEKPRAAPRICKDFTIRIDFRFIRVRRVLWHKSVGRSRQFDPATS